MKERSRMDVLDYAGQGDVPVPLITAELCRENEDHGSEPLSPAPKKVFTDFRDEFDVGIEILFKFRLDPFEIVFNEKLDNRIHSVGVAI
jgi:hypothetical protein